MDKNVLEFWADFFQNAAKSQKQIDSFNKWLQQGLAGYEAFLSLMGKPYAAPGKQDSGRSLDQVTLCRCPHVAMPFVHRDLGQHAQILQSAELVVDEGL